VEAVSRHEHVDLPLLNATAIAPGSQADPVRTHEWLAGVGASAGSRPRISTLLRWFAAGVSVWIAIALLIGFVALERYKLPAPTGSYAVGTSILNFTDQSRYEDPAAHNGARRGLVAQVWYPAMRSAMPIAKYQRWKETTAGDFYNPLLHTHSRMDAPLAITGGPFPVLLFGHRWGGQRTQDTALCEDLASHGYVVVSVDHPYNSARIEMADGKIIAGNEAIEGPSGKSTPAAQQIAFWNATLNTWTADDIFVLNQLAVLNILPGSRFQGGLDTARVGAFGHSFGGAVAFSLLGRDPRVRSAVNLDGWTFGALNARTTQPILVVYEQEAIARRRQLTLLPQPGTTDDQLDRADFEAVDASLSRFGGDALYVAGTQHMDFTDQPLLPPLRRPGFTGPIVPAHIQSILRTTVLSFFESTLQNRALPSLGNNPGKGRDITLEHHPVPAHP
jgi:dienelactone hydrolase